MRGEVRGEVQGDVESEVQEKGTMKFGMKYLAYGAPLIGFLALSAFLLVGLEKDPKHLPSAKIGRLFPEFSLTSLAQPATVLSHKDFSGQAGLVNVWATWCPSCKIEHGTLNQLAEKGVVIYGVNYKDDRQAAQRYLSQYGNPFKINVFDVEGDLGLDLGVYGAPETFVIDDHGVILYRHAGVVDETVWTDVFKPMLDSLQRNESDNQHNGSDGQG